MTAEEDERRQWRLLWLGSIQAFADSYASSHFSFAECMSGYFDDAYLRERDAYQRRLARGQVTSAEVTAVAEFHSLAECYESPNEDDQNTRAILQDPKWREVVAAARDARERLGKLLNDPSEKDALRKPLYGRQRADATFLPSPLTGAEPNLGRKKNDIGWRLFALTKPVSPTTSGLPAELRRQLARLGFHARRNEHGVTYTVGPFELGHNRSMFAAFTEVSLVEEGGLWVLRFRINVLYWLIFAILPVVLLFKPDQFWPVFALITGLVAGSLLWVRVRLSRWWNRL